MSRVILDIIEDINTKKLEKLREEYIFEMLKLKICVNLETVMEVLSESYPDVGGKIAKALLLDNQEREMLDHIKLIDIDVKKIGESLHNLKERITP